MLLTVTPPETPQALALRDQAIASARQYANRSRADSTWRAYESDWRIFSDWCLATAAIALPASPETVAGFLAIEADAGRAVSTLRRRLAAIRLMHVASNHPSPHDTLKVTEVLSGIARSQRSRKPRQAQAALEPDIRRMVDGLNTETAQGLRDRALLLVGFDGALRRSELVAITVDAITRHPDGLLIDLPYSKTDQHGVGQTVAILARPGSPYCPVSALDAWIAKAPCSSGVVFRRLRRGGRVDDAGLSAQSVALILKNAAVSAGYPANNAMKFSGHSLRRGVITEAARAGESLAAIMQLSRHRKADSTMVYVNREGRLKTHAGKTLLR